MIIIFINTNILYYKNIFMDDPQHKIESKSNLFNLDGGFLINP